MEERYELTIERIMRITSEETVREPYRRFFCHVANFLLRIHDLKESLAEEARSRMQREHLDAEMNMLYQDVLAEYYETSYANPAYAVKMLGKESGAFLCALYAELRGEISYVYAGRTDYIIILNELFVEIYNRFEGEELPSVSSLKEIFYWYASDYCDVFAADRVREEIDPSMSEAALCVITESNLQDLRYLYQFGEYISDKEWERAVYLNSLTQEEIDASAENVLNVLRDDIMAGSTIGIQLIPGMERLIRKIVRDLQAKDVNVMIKRRAVSVITRNGSEMNTFGQYEYDHRYDIGLFLGKRFVERKVEVMRTTFEQNRKMAENFAGVLVLKDEDVTSVLPKEKEEAIHLNEKQEELWTLMNEKIEQLTLQYRIGCIYSYAPFVKQKD